jgi:hypothetical protein
MAVPRIGRRIRYADVASTIAVVFAMSGTAFAASSLAANSVGTTQLKDGAVTTPKLHAKAVGSAKLAVGAVTGSKIAAGAVDSAAISDQSITSEDLGTDSVQASEIADQSIDGGEIIDNSLSGTDIASSAIGTSELADSSVTGAKVANNSLTLSDIQGANASGGISFGIGANSCTTLNFGVSGAQVGEAALLSFTSTAPPSTFLLGPLRVSAANTVTGFGCNVGASALSVSGLGVRIITFG